ncbi:MAG TPA: hypothetical protein DCQ93_10910 [Bacteroidetes bacterium]|nr:hypothetical protein [Bacteroidota bacterium]
MHKRFFQFAILIALLPLFSSAQKIFTEGSIKYKMSVSGVDDPQSSAMLQNMMMTFYIKNGKTATEMDMGFVKNKTIEVDENNYVLLMEMMGNKYKVTMNKPQMEARKNMPKDSDYEITVTNDTKVIAGYNCKKAIIKMNKDNQTFYAYFTDEIKSAASQSNSYYGKINGMLLEYSFGEKGMTMTMTADSISFDPVSDDVFTVPATGYTEMSLDQLKKLGQ